MPEILHVSPTRKPDRYVHIRGDPGGQGYPFCQLNGLKWSAFPFQFDLSTCPSRHWPMSDTN